jgi:hypothetical protein
MAEPNPQEVEPNITWKEAVEAWRTLLQAARNLQTKEETPAGEKENQL